MVATEKRKPFEKIDRKNRKGPLRHRCEHCKTEALSDTAIRCPACQCVRYCDQLHANAHASNHKKECDRVTQEYAKAKDSEDRIVHLENNPTGDDWEDRQELDFLRNASQSFHCLILSALADIDTLDAYRRTLQAGCRYLKLFPGDEDAVRYPMAIAMLQLDLDQTCWDFLFWWRSNCHFDRPPSLWLDVDKLHLNGINADIFKRLPFADIPHHRHVFLSISILLKLKVAIDLKNIHLARRIVQKGKLPTELCHHILKHVCRSPLSERFQHETPDKIEAAMKDLVRQVSVLGAELNCVDAKLSQWLLRNRNLLKSLRRRKLPFKGNTGNEYADNIEREYMDIAMVYAAFQQTSEVITVLRHADAIFVERSSDSLRNANAWQYLSEVFDMMLVREVQ